MYYAFKLITTLFLLISLTVTGCQTEATPAAITPPTDVTNLNALNKDSSVLLTWIDSTDEDVIRQIFHFTKTIKILYHSETSVKNQIENLIKIYGKDGFDSLRQEKQLYFFKQGEIRWEVENN